MSAAPPFVRIDGDLAFGTSPDQAGLRLLARKHGFRSILCLNAEGEPDQILSPNVEASWAHTYRLVHGRASLPAHLPDAPSLAGALDRLAELPRPTYVHSRHGARAGAVLALVLATEQALAPEEALARAQELGLDPGPPSWRQAVMRVIEERLAAAR